MAVFNISGTVTAAATAQGIVVVEASSLSSEDASYNATGRRRAFPIIVYATDVINAAGASSVPWGGAFLTGSPISDQFIESGGSPGYIGYRSGGPGKEYFQFRNPDSLSVWNYHTKRLMRHTKDGWTDYRSMPQRALDGMQAFSVFDPDGAYDYVAGLMGALQSCLSNDNATLARVNNPETCPSAFLIDYAKSIRAEVRPDRSSVDNRAHIAQSLSIARVRGTLTAVSTYMKTLGYTVSVYEIADRLGWPLFYVRSSDEVAAPSTSVRVSASSTHMVRLGFGSTDTDPVGIFYLRNYFNPVGAVLIDSNGDGSPDSVQNGDWASVSCTFSGVYKKLTMYFRDTTTGVSPQLPANTSDTTYVSVDIGVSPEASTASQYTMDNIVTAVNSWATAASGVPGLVLVYGSVSLSTHGYPQYLVRMHGYDTRHPHLYWPSNKLLVIINGKNGEMRYLSGSDLIEVRDALKMVIPANARVFSYGTAAPTMVERISVGESFTVTVV